jgi:alpha-tubulin suppressor-like RCC1 family protein
MSSRRSARSRLALRNIAPRAAVLPVITLLTLGCGEETPSPMAPDQPAELLSAATSPLAFRQISTGLSHACGVTTTSVAYCWGRNNTGQLGDGSTTQRLRPTAVSGGLKFLMVTAGAQYSCGVTTDNRVFCWGDNTTGQLGDGSISRRLKPVAVAGGRRYRQVRAGYFHTCAINTSDVAFCWGKNGNGQVGDGTTTARLVPAKVKTTLTWRWVFAAGLHTCGATTDFRAFCWGRNEDGQLGDGTTVQKFTPVEVESSDAFRLATVGAFKGNGDAWTAVSCGLIPDGLAYCWGDNSTGALGDGTHTKRSSPAAVDGDHQFNTLSVGAAHVCGLTTASRAFCWGSNGNGELGIGATTSSISSPVAVSGGLTFKAVTAGTIFTCGIAADDHAYCWGANQYGQLGNGTANDGPVITPHTTPAPVLGPA